MSFDNEGGTILLILRSDVASQAMPLLCESFFTLTWRKIENSGPAASGREDRL